MDKQKREMENWCGQNWRRRSRKGLRIEHARMTRGETEKCAAVELSKNVEENILLHDDRFTQGCLRGSCKGAEHHRGSSNADESY
jgi:hypothetical protein